MAGHLSFMRTPCVDIAQLRPGMLAALGIALDSGSPDAGITRFGPTALRETSAYFGSHFSSNMKAAMDIDRRRVLDGGLLSGCLVDLGDLCIEGLCHERAASEIAQAVAAIVSRGAMPLLLGGSLEIATAALDGLDADARDLTVLIQVGGEPIKRDGSKPVAWLAPSTHSEAAMRPASAFVNDLTLTSAQLKATREDELLDSLGAWMAGRRAVVVLDLSAFAASWHGMHGAAPFDSLGLRDVRKLMAILGRLPTDAIAVTGLDATRSGLSTVKTGQRLLVTALLDLLYAVIAQVRASRSASCS
jgi:agmatinase